MQRTTNENASASTEFLALTENEAARVTGGDGLASAVGWFVGYAVACTQQALAVDWKVITGQPISYQNGVGFY